MYRALTEPVRQLDRPKRFSFTSADEYLVPAQRATIPEKSVTRKSIISENSDARKNGKQVEIFESFLEALRLDLDSPIADPDRFLSSIHQPKPEELAPNTTRSLYIPSQPRHLLVPLATISAKNPCRQRKMRQTPFDESSSKTCALTAYKAQNLDVFVSSKYTP